MGYEFEEVAVIYFSRLSAAHFLRDVFEIGIITAVSFFGAHGQAPLWHFLERKDDGWERPAEQERDLANYWVGKLAMWN